MDAGIVRLDPGTTKNDEGRVFVFGLIDELKTVLEGQRDAAKLLAKEKDKIVRFVFNRNGERVKTFRKAWLNACVAAGCPGRIPHDFRRTAVRNLVRASVPERVAMKMTGHKTRSVFERYNIVSNTDLNLAARQLNSFVFRKNG